MKSTVMSFRPKSFLLVLTSVIMILCLSSCAAQADFQVSSVVPAARGSVTVKKDKYNNYLLDIKLTDLAEAGRLTPPKNTYVVWMITDENYIKNIGQIKTSKSLFSKKLNAEFETKSSFRPVRIFITAEYDPEIQNTNSEVVLTTADFNLTK
jgi:hypothetical protein